MKMIRISICQYHQLKHREASSVLNREGTPTFKIIMLVSTTIILTLNSEVEGQVVSTNLEVET